MSRHPLPNVEERILQATFAVAGNSEPNRFSTQEIAEKAGLSEFVIYDHFKTKENLIAEGRAYIFDEFVDALLAQVERTPDFLPFFNAMLDYALARSDELRFALTYDDLFPRSQLPKDYASYKAKVSERIVAPLEKKIPLAEDLELCYQVSDHWMREYLLDAELLLNGTIADTPQNRRWMGELIYWGFSFLTKKANTPD